MLLLDSLLFLKFMANIFLSLSSFYCVMVAVFSYSAKQRALRQNTAVILHLEHPWIVSVKGGVKIAQSVEAGWEIRQAEGNYLVRNLLRKLRLVPLLFWKAHGVFSNHSGQDFRFYFNYQELFCTFTAWGEGEVELSLYVVCVLNAIQ